jgi:OOP family OmpA-OmpF porin
MTNAVLVRCACVLTSVLMVHAAAAQAPEASTPDSDPEAPYEPKPRQFELGAILGFMVPSTDHNLRSETAIQRSYGFAPEIGLRAGHLLAKAIGLEFEGVWMWTRTEDDSSSNLFAGRVHLLGQLPMGRVAPFAVFGGGALGGGSATMGTDTDPAIHFGLGVKFAVTEAIGVRLDLRDTMHQKFDAEQGSQTHSPEVLFGLTLALEPRHEPAPPAAAPVDTDADGFADPSDACPREAGIAPRGCPDEDTDGDTVLDSKDACPAEPGPPAGCGCAAKDADEDGVPDDLDKCPNEAGTLNGCPDLDPDHDGVEAPLDKCPDKAETKNGFDDDDGCPDEIPEKIRQFTGIIKGIEFDTANDSIRPVSEPVLENALLVFNEFPKTRIEISGHTDGIGKREDNLDLSKRRAESVKRWFVGKGIDERRIETRGAGPDQPISDNRLPAGRQKNRRIEFKLLE